MSRSRDIADLGGVTTRLDQVGNSDGALSNRNMVINGAMQVAQRGTSVTGLGSQDGYFTIDRYKLDFGGTDGRLTMSQSTDAPNGFGNSLKLECTTADTSIGSSEKGRIICDLEGQDLQSIAKGTPDAHSIAVSFYVKGNDAATYAFEIFDTDNSRQCSKLFNVTSEWTRVVLIFPPDTTGKLTNDNNTSLQLSFHFHAGSAFTSGAINSDGFAANNNANRLKGINSFFDSTDRTLQITGVQLEVGDTSTDFEHISVGDQLQKCMRYYQQYGGGSAYHGFFVAGSYNTSTASGYFELSGHMRAPPTGSATGTFEGGNGYTQTATLTNFSPYSEHDGSCKLVNIRVNGNGSSYITGGFLRVRAQNDITARIKFDAEL